MTMPRPLHRYLSERILKNIFLKENINRKIKGDEDEDDSCRSSASSPYPVRVPEEFKDSTSRNVNMISVEHRPARTLTMLEFPGISTIGDI